VTAPPRPRPSRARETRALLARRGDIELQFVQPRRRGRVHVVVPADPDLEPALVQWSDLSAVDQATCMLGLARRIVPTLCGFTATVYWDNSGRHEFVDTFDDLDLCQRCHDLLGREHEARAFEHPRPGGESDVADE